MLAKWINQGAEIERLRSRITELEADKESLLWRCDALEKQITVERNKKDKYVIEYSNALSRMAGLGQSKLFSEAREEKPKTDAPTHNYSDLELAQLQEVAEAMRLADIDRGIDVPAVEYYLDRIKDDPTAYIPGYTVH